MREILTFEDKTGKTGTIFMFLTQSDKVLVFFLHILWHFLHISLRKILIKKI